MRERQREGRERERQREGTERERQRKKDRERKTESRLSCIPSHLTGGYRAGTSRRPKAAFNYRDLNIMLVSKAVPYPALGLTFPTIFSLLMSTMSHPITPE